MYDSTRRDAGGRLVSCAGGTGGAGGGRAGAHRASARVSNVPGLSELLMGRHQTWSTPRRSIRPTRLAACTAVAVKIRRSISMTMLAIMYDFDKNQSSIAVGSIAPSKVVTFPNSARTRSGSG